MATFRSKYTNNQIEETLDRSREMDNTPFYLYYDASNKKYRFFATTERRDAWITARDTGTMTSEIAAYEFTESFDAPAPYTVTIGNLDEVRNVRYGKTGITIDYYFRTTDSFSTRFNESVDVTYTIDSPAGTNTVSTVYSCDTQANYTSVSFNIDKYISVGKNVISILVKGRSSGASRLASVTLNLFVLSISSSFQINEAIAPYEDIKIPVTVNGSGSKNLLVYIDGTQVATRQISEAESNSVIVVTVKNHLGTYGSGKHTLQLQASLGSEYTNYLYYEFVISGKVLDTNTNTLVDQRQILIQTEIEAAEDGSGYVQNELPTLYAEQFVSKTIKYSYYSSNTVSEYTALIQWELENSSMQIQPINLDSISESKVGTLSNLTLIPTEVASETRPFVLKAKIKENYTASDGSTVYSYIGGVAYPFVVAENSKVAETKSGLTMKLSAHGRSNSEPSESRGTWNYVKSDDNGNFNYSTTFSQNFQWSGDYGWSNNTLSVKSGTWCRINNKPFSQQIAPQDKYGCTFEIEFMTCDIDDDDATVLSIGDTSGNNGAYFQITGSQAKLVSSSGTEISTRFKSNERVKIAFVVYPRQEDATSYPRMIFIQVNGILSCCQLYTTNEIFNIGSTTEPDNPFGMINIGTTTGGAGIKIYSIRTYNKFINMYEEMNNFIIDCGDDITEKVEDNDIYSSGDYDFTKISSQVTTVYIEGNLDVLIGAKEKDEVEAKIEVRSPNDPAINMTSSHVKLSNAGQSTLNMPVPSLHVKFGTYADNQLKDSDGNIIVGNRWAFKTSNTPEKKVRLQANYMDSSGCHNGSFLKMWNTMAKKLKINDKYVLLPPALRMIYDTEKGYSYYMQQKYGANPNRSDGVWKFPYDLNPVPDSIPCIVAWKKPGDTKYKLLGQYVLMEEKKSDFTSCKRSVYTNVDTDGNPDPFTFRTAKTKVPSDCLWDNKDTRQYEIVSNVGSLTYFNSISSWSKMNPDTAKYQYETDFEMIYPDPDDIAEDEGAAAVTNYWNEFRDKFVKRVCDTYQNQTAFNSLYCDGPNQIFDRWAWASYYCLALRNCCVDSMVRNMQLMTFGEFNTYTDATSAKVTGTNWLWLPKWWDVDMQCGLLQSGALGASPCSDRNTRVAGSYLFSGKNAADGSSSWLWDALENCEQFRQDVNTIDGLMYDNGWRYDNITEIQDGTFIDSWNESIFNESGLVKYVDIYNTQVSPPVRTTAYTFMMQGDRTPHRHWFLKTSYGYFDALHNCGDYVNNSISFTPFNAPSGSRYVITPSEDFYFGYGINKIPQVSGVKGTKGEEMTLAINNSIGSKDTTELYAVNKLEKIDMSDFSKYYNGTMDLGKTSDAVLGTVIKELILGASSINKINSESDAVSQAGNSMNAKTVTFAGISTMTRLEKLNIRGLLTLKTVTDDISSEISLQSLHELYAAGSGITSFHPKEGSTLSVLELPTTVTEITMKNCSLSACSISWYKTNTTTRMITVSGTDTIENVYYVSQTASGNPTPTLQTIDFTAMGEDTGAQNLIKKWLHVLRDSAEITAGMTEAEKDAAIDKAFETAKLTYTNAIWYNMEYDDLLLIARIPEARRNLNGGYIVCKNALTSEQMNTLMQKFGDHIFTENSLLTIDCNSELVKITVTGGQATVTEQSGVTTIEVIQGSEYQFGGITFPVRRTGTAAQTKTWYLAEKNSRGNYDAKKASESSDIISTIRPLKLNAATGVLVVDECEEPAIVGDKIKLCVDTSDNKYGEVFLQVARRTYPTSVRIQHPNSLDFANNKLQIITGNTYTLSAIHSNPDSYTGNLSSENGGVWSLDGLDRRYISHTDKDLTYALTINSNFGNYFEEEGIEEKEFTLHYTSHWMDPTSSCSTSIDILLISVIQELLSFSTYYGNKALYYALENNNGLIHTGGESGLFYSSLDLKYGTGIINFREYIEKLPPSKGVDLSNFTTMRTTNSKGTTYNVAKYLPNVNAFNLSGCEYFTDELNVEGLYNLTSVDMRNTAAGANVAIGTSSWLRNIYYGTPSAIDITTPKYLKRSDISVENTSHLKSININKLSEGKEMSLLLDMINNSNTVSNPLPAVTSINVVSNGAEDFLGRTGLAIEKLKNVVANRNPSGNISATIKTNKLYEASKAALRTRYPSLTINNDADDGYYVPWKDSSFLERVSNTTYNLGGDGVGITFAQAASSTNTTLGNAIKSCATISDLSDLYYFSKLKMEDCATEGESQFAYCAGLQKVSIPQSVTKIGKNTFVNLHALSSIDFTHASALTSIDTGSFVSCGDNGGINIDIQLGSIPAEGGGSTAVCPRLAYADLTGLSNKKIVKIDNLDTLTKLII